MIWQLNPYAIPLQIGAIISGLIAYSSWHRVTIPGRRAFALFMLAIAIWMFGYGLELTFIPLDPRDPLIPKIEYLGIATSAPLWFIFLLKYAGFNRWLNRQTQALLFVIPAATIFVVWFYNDIFWESITLVERGPYTLVSFVHGFWFNVIHTPYSYLLYGSSIFLLLYIARNSPRLNRTQSALLLIGFLIPLLSNVLYVVGGVSFFPGLDLTPFTLASIGLVVAWVLFQFRLLESVPIASQAVVQGMPDGVLMLDKRNWVVELNPSAQRIFDHDPRSVIGLDVSLVIPPDWYAEVTQVPPESSTTIEVQRETTGAATAYFDLQIAPLYDRRQRLMGRLLVFRDITASKQATADLFASQQRLQTVVSSAPMAIFACDANGIIHTVVGDEVANVGVEPETLIGQSAFVAFQEFKDIVSSVRLALGGQSFTREFKIARHIYEVWYKPAQDEQGNITGVIVVVVNVTEQKRAAAALQESQRLESIGLLAGGIAHDFNNLLASVMGQTSIARSMLAETDTAVSHLELALDGAERATQLTRQLLAYAGKGSIEQKVVDLNELLVANTELLQTTFSKQVQLSLELSERPATIRGDSGQIQQIIMNLVINAVESIEGEDGLVTISTEHFTIDADTDLASWRNGENLSARKYILLQIQDNGSGIPESDLRRIFEPFFTTKLMGRGLGLSAALGIIRSHQGSLRIKSQPGEGSTFSVLLPYYQMDVAPPVADAALADLPQVKTVLLVDDDASVRRMLHDMLKRQGARIIEAVNGRQALTLFDQHQDDIDLVFLDMQMPVMDGAETFQHLRKRSPMLKIMMTSGYSESEAMDFMAEDTFVDFIQKPFRLRQLQAKMVGLLSKRQQEA